MNINDLFAHEEAKLADEYRAEIAAEDAAYAALPQAEKDRIQAERDAKWAALDAAFDEAFEAYCEDDDLTREDDEEDDDDY